MTKKATPRVGIESVDARDAAGAVSGADVEIDRRYYVEAAARAIQLLEAVGEHAPVTLAVLTAELGWTKPMVYRLVRTLQSSRAVRLTDDGYTLGPALISLGHAALRSIRLVDATRPALKRIHDDTGESVVLTVRNGTDAVYVDFIETDHLLVTRARIGSHLPAHLTASGHALLSRHSPEELRALYREYNFSAPMAHSVSDLDVLERRLEIVRSRGYALVDQEIVAGHRAVAAPVIDHTGRPVAAISISVPTARVELGSLRTMADQVLLPTIEQLNGEFGAPHPMTAGTSRK